MIIFPATDIIGGKAVRLTRGDYAQMTVYSDDPVAVAKGFFEAGAEYLHAVDLEGARDGGTPNFETVKTLAKQRVWTYLLGTSDAEKEDCLSTIYTLAASYVLTNK